MNSSKTTDQTMPSSSSQVRTENTPEHGPRKDHQHLDALAGGTAISQQDHHNETTDKKEETHLADTNPAFYHPREVAEDTIQHLLDFTHALEKLSLQTAQSAETPSFYLEFSRLVDGISTMIEGIYCIKDVLKIQSEAIPPLKTLEDDLLSILQDLLVHQEQKQPIQMVPILKERLIQNLQSWRHGALPAIIRARDC